MDNASTHMYDEVEAAIRATGAILIYGAPYSPHLHPIENYYCIYKRNLKRNSERMNDDWRGVHMGALNFMGRDCSIKYFHCCGIPGSRTMLTSDKYQELLRIYYSV